jgi:hypothetical protein
MDQLLWPPEASDALGSSTIARRIRAKHERVHIHAMQANTHYTTRRDNASKPKSGAVAVKRS